MNPKSELEAKRRFWDWALTVDFFVIAACAMVLATKLNGKLQAPPVPASPAQPLDLSELSRAVEPVAKLPISKIEAAAPAAPSALPLPEAAPAAAKAPEAAAVPGRAQPVEFAYGEKGRSVSVAASFNGWKPKRLAKRGGAWKLKAYLKPGTYRYHFVVDGQARPDPANPLKEGENSVLVVPAPR